MCRWKIQMKWFINEVWEGVWVQNYFLWGIGDHPPMWMLAPTDSLNPLTMVFCGALPQCACGGGGSVAHSCPALCNPMICSLPLSTDFQTRILRWVCHFLLRDLPHLGVKQASPVSPALTSDSCHPLNTPGKPHSSSRDEQVITPLPVSLPHPYEGWEEARVEIPGF